MTFLWTNSTRATGPCRCPVKCPPNCSVKMSAHQVVRVFFRWRLLAFALPAREGCRQGCGRAGRRRCAARAASAARAAEDRPVWRRGRWRPPSSDELLEARRRCARRGTKTKSAGAGAPRRGACPDSRRAGGRRGIRGARPGRPRTSGRGGRAGSGPAGSRAARYCRGPRGACSGSSAVREIARRPAPGGRGVGGRRAKRRLWSTR